MTARNGIVCVEWQGPFFLRFDFVNRGKRDEPLVYRIIEGEETVYIGCTRHPLPYRMAVHVRAPTRIGQYIRQVRSGERRACVTILEGAGHKMEAVLIRAERPRLNVKHVPGRGDGLIGNELDLDRRFAIAAMRVRGETYAAIGRRFGISRQAVHQMFLTPVTHLSAAP